MVDLIEGRDSPDPSVRERFWEVRLGEGEQFISRGYGEMAIGGGMPVWCIFRFGAKVRDSIVWE